MKKKKVMSLAIYLLVLAGLIMPKATIAQEYRGRIVAESKIAKEKFIKADPLMKNLFEDAYAYVIFPNVGKGAIGVGGAAGRGAVFEKGKPVGTAKMTQLSVGLQLGGRAYREVIFFENLKELRRFRENKFEFNAQVSAVVVKSGASGNAKYTDGVMIFSQEKAGLMGELSIGGQKFSYTQL